MRVVKQNLKTTKLWKDFWDTKNNHTNLATVLLIKSEEHVVEIREDIWRPEGRRLLREFDQKSQLFSSDNYFGRQPLDSGDEDFDWTY